MSVEPTKDGKKFVKSAEKKLSGLWNNEIFSIY